MTNNDDLALKLKKLAQSAGADEWQAKKISGDYYVIRKGSYQAVSGFRTYQPIAEIEHKPTRDYVAAASPANIHALLAERDADKAENASLRQRVAELEDDAQGLIRFREVMQEATLALNSGEPLNLESLFRGELASSMFAMMFAGELTRSGATNYLELLYDVPGFGDFTVTINKVEGKTPGERIAELESYIDTTADFESCVTTSLILSGHLEPDVTFTQEALLELLRSVLVSKRTVSVKLPRYDLDMSDCDSCGQDCGADMSEEPDGDYVLLSDVIEKLAAAGIKLEVEE